MAEHQRVAELRHVQLTFGRIFEYLRPAIQDDEMRKLFSVPSRFFLKLFALGAAAVVVYLHFLFRFLNLPENPFVYVQLHITIPALIGAAVLARQIARDPSKLVGWRKWAAWLSWTAFGLVLFPVLVLSFTEQEFSVSDPWVVISFFRGFDVATAVPLGWRLHAPALASHIAGFIGILAASLWFARRHTGTIAVLAGLAVWMVLQLPGIWTGRPEHALIDPAEDIQNPILQASPAIQKNVIIYYFEGMEEAFTEIPSTAGHMKPLLDKAASAVWLRGINQVPGTEYSVAGYVATQCGVPLVPKGRQNRIWDTTPDHILREGFMPAVDCLPDVLARDGYETVFIHGMDLSNFAIEEFLTSHAYQKIIDRKAMSIAGEVRANAWGADDTTHRKFLTAELERLAAQDRPFFLAFENTGTHGPSGFPDADCTARHGGKADLASSVECGVADLMAFFATVDRLGLTDDTIILVTSDHLQIHSDLAAELEATGKERVNFTFLLGTGLPAQQIVRQGTMMDVYPTLLETLGYKVENGRAGIGRSLLQPGQTLVEQHGLTTTRAIFQYNASLKSHLWRAE